MKAFFVFLIAYLFAYNITCLPPPPRPIFPLYFETRGLGLCKGSGTFSCPPEQSANATFDFHQWWEFDPNSGYLVREREDDLVQPGPIVYGRSYLDFNATTNLDTLSLYMLYQNASSLICSSMQVQATPLSRNYLQSATFVGLTTLRTGETCYEFLNYFVSTAAKVDWTTWISTDGEDRFVGLKSDAQMFEEYYDWTQGSDQPFDPSIFTPPNCGNNKAY